MGDLSTVAVMIAQMTAWDVAFVVLVIGILLTMTGAFGDPNLVIVGIAISITGIVGMFLGPYSTPVVLGAMIPIVGFLLYYLYRHVEFSSTERPEQTSNAQTLRGTTGRVTTAVTPRDGEVDLDRPGFHGRYRARSTEGRLEKGTRVVVVDPGGGNVLTVAPEGTDLPAIEESDDVGWKIVADIRRGIERLRRRLAGE